VRDRYTKNGNLTGFAETKRWGNGLWQNFAGSLKGVTVYLFIPPLPVEPEGQQAMLAFGLAHATEKPAFTFPYAARLKSNALAVP